MEDSQTTGFWALVELFGHQCVAGHVSSETLGGQTFVRVDIPETPNQKPWSKLYGAGAIYAITPMAEDLVRARAEKLEVAPLEKWDLPPSFREKMRMAISGPANEIYPEFEE